MRVHFVLRYLFKALGILIGLVLVVLGILAGFSLLFLPTHLSQEISVPGAVCVVFLLIAGGGYFLFSLSHKGSQRRLRRFPGKKDMINSAKRYESLLVRNDRN